MANRGRRIRWGSTPLVVEQRLGIPHRFVPIDTSRMNEADRADVDAQLARVREQLDFLLAHPHKDRPQRASAQLAAYEREVRSIVGARLSHPGKSRFFLRVFYVTAGDEVVFVDGDIAPQTECHVEATRALRGYGVVAAEVCVEALRADVAEHPTRPGTKVRRVVLPSQRTEQVEILNESAA